MLWEAPAPALPVEERIPLVGWGARRKSAPGDLADSDVALALQLQRDDDAAAAQEMADTFVANDATAVAESLRTARGEAAPPAAAGHGDVQPWQLLDGPRVAAPNDGGVEGENLGSTGTSTSRGTNSGVAEDKDGGFDDLPILDLPIDGACELCGATENLLHVGSRSYCNNRSQPDESSCFMSQVHLNLRAHLSMSSRWPGVALRCPVSHETDVRRLVMIAIDTSEVAILSAAVALRACPGFRAYPAVVDGGRILAPWAVACHRNDTVVAARARVTQRVAAPPPVIPLRFDSDLEHLRHFMQAVSLAAEEELSNQRLLSKRLTARWTVGTPGSHIAFVEYNTDSREDLSVYDSVTLTPADRDEPGTAVRGLVVWASGATVGILAEVSPDAGLWDIAPEGMTVAIDRMQTALHFTAFDSAALLPHIKRYLLGIEPAEPSMRVVTLPRSQSFDVPTQSPLSEAQTGAVRHAMTSSETMIQGPPGTGKTKTAVATVYHWVKEGSAGPVLVCAGSNPAATHIATEIAGTGLKVIRYMAGSRIGRLPVPSSVSIESYVALSDELKSLRKLRDKSNWLPQEQLKRLKKLERETYLKALAEVDVIVCTCSAAGDSLMSRLTFRRVLIDEAAQITEPEALIPLSKGCEQFVLVGDHRQLRPLVKCDAAAKAGLGVSLFERLVKIHPEDLCFLDVQHRMHTALSAAPNAVFYDGRIRDADGIDERRRTPFAFPWPTLKPFFWWHCSAPEQTGPGGRSYLNTAEGRAVVEAVSLLVERGADPAEIGVIAPYGAQKTHIRSLFDATRDADNTLPEWVRLVQVDTVDSFQGREKDYIVLAQTRSNSSKNERQAVGFVSDPRRANVALTRARMGTIVVGDASTLARCALWQELLSFWSDTIVQGPLSALTSFEAPAVVAAVATQRDFFRTYVPSTRSAVPGPCTLHCMCGASDCRRLSAGFVDRASLRDYTLRAAPLLWESVQSPDFSIGSSPVFGAFECADGDHVYSDAECDAQRWLRECSVSDAPELGQITLQGFDDLTGTGTHEQALRALSASQLSVCAALAIELSTDASELPTHLGVRRTTRLPQTAFGLLRRLQWFWRARIVGWMTVEETTRYWTYANSRLDTARESLVALCTACSFDRGGALTRLLQSGVWWSRFKHLVPTRSDRGVLRMGSGLRDALPRLNWPGSFYRKVREVECMYGARAVLKEMATQIDFDAQSDISEILAEFYNLYCVFVQKLLPRGCIACGFCNPGGHTYGVLLAGFHAAGLDIADDVEDFRRWFYDILPKRSPTLPVATILRGDALLESEREKAVAEHPLADDCIANFDSPCCRAYTTMNLRRGVAPMIIGAPGPRNADAIASARLENLGECIHMLHQKYLQNGTPYVVETVLGNGSFQMPPGVSCTKFDGLAFGLRTRDIHRFYHPTDCPLFVDDALRDGSRRLASKTCAGSSRVTQPRGPDGVPLGAACCIGQLCSFYNSGYTAHDRRQMCDAIKVDPAHVTSKNRLNDMLPPSMGRHASSQAGGVGVAMCRFGVPAVSFTHASVDPRLGAWIIDLLRRGEPVAPIQRVVVIITPAHMPGRVLTRCVDSQHLLPEVTVGRGSLVDNVCTAFHLAFPEVTVVQRLRFVCDILNAGTPTAVFCTSSLADGDVAKLVNEGNLSGLAATAVSHVAKLVADSGEREGADVQRYALSSWIAMNTRLMPTPDAYGDTPTLEALAAWRADHQHLECVPVTAVGIVRARAQCNLKRDKPFQPPVEAPSAAGSDPAPGAESPDAVPDQPIFSIDTDATHDEASAVLSLLGQPPHATWTSGEQGENSGVSAHVADAVRACAAEASDAKAKAANDALATIRAWWRDNLGLRSLITEGWVERAEHRLGLATNLDWILRSTFDTPLVLLPSAALHTFDDGPYLVELHKLLTALDAKSTCAGTPPPGDVASSERDEAKWDAVVAAADAAEERAPDSVLATVMTAGAGYSDTAANTEQNATRIGLHPSCTAVSAAATEAVAPVDDGVARLSEVPMEPGAFELLQDEQWVPPPEAKLVNYSVGNDTTASTALAAAADIPYNLVEEFAANASSVGLSNALSSSGSGNAPGLPNPVGLTAVCVVLQWNDYIVAQASGPFKPSVFTHYNSALETQRMAAKPVSSFDALDMARTTRSAINAVSPWFVGRASWPILRARIKAAVDGSVPVEATWTTTARNHTGRLTSRSVPARRVTAKVFLVRLAPDFDWTTPHTGFSSRGITKFYPHLVVGATIGNRLCSSVYEAGHLDSDAHEALPLTAPLTIDSANNLSRPLDIAKLYAISRPVMDMYFDVHSDPIAVAVNKVLSMHAPLDPAACAAIGASGSEDDESSDASDSGSSSDDSELQYDTETQLRRAEQREQQLLQCQLLRRARLDRADYRLCQYVTLFFKASVWSHISAKMCESRLWSAFLARVRVGWLIQCRANLQSSACWKRVKAGPFLYSSHAKCAQAHKSALIPWLSDHTIEITDETSLEWIFFEMHTNYVTKRAIHRWCHATNKTGRVLCWELENLPPHALLPPARNEVVDGAVPLLHHRSRVHFRRMATRLLTRLHSANRAARRVNEIHCARRFFAIYLRAVLKLCLCLLARSQRLRNLRARAALGVIAGKLVFQPRSVLQNAKLKHKLVSRHLACVDAATERAERLCSWRSLAKLLRFRQYRPPSTLASSVFCVRTAPTGSLEVYVHERYATLGRSGPTATFVPSGKANAIASATFRVHEQPHDSGEHAKLSLAVVLEEPVATAAREFEEEAGLSLDPARLLPSWTDRGFQLNGTWKLTDFVVHVSAAEAARVAIQEPAKHSQDRWLSLEAIRAIPREHQFDRLAMRSAAAITSLRQHQLRQLAIRLAYRTRRLTWANACICHCGRQFLRRKHLKWRGKVRRLVLASGLADPGVRRVGITAIAISVPCEGRRAKGANLAVATHYLHATPYAIRQHDSNAPADAPGTLQSVWSGDPTECPHVVSMFTDKFDREPSARDGDGVRHRAERLQACLADLAVELERRNITTVAFPWRLGCAGGYKQWPAHRTAIALFARSNPRLSVYVVQSSAASIRQNQQTRIRDVKTATRDARAYVNRLSPGPTRTIGLQLVQQLSAQLTDSACADGSGDSEADEPAAMAQLAQSASLSDESADGEDGSNIRSIFAAKLASIVDHLSKVDEKKADAAQQAVRALNDRDDLDYRKSIIERLHDKSLTEEEVLAGHEDYTRNWLSREAAQVFRDEARHPCAPVRLHGLSQTDMNGRCGVITKRFKTYDAHARLPDDAYVQLTALPAALFQYDGRHGNVVRSKGDRYTVSLSNDSGIELADLPRECLTSVSAVAVALNEPEEDGRFQTVRVNCTHVVDDRASGRDALSRASTRPSSPVPLAAVDESEDEDGPSSGCAFGGDAVNVAEVNLSVARANRVTVSSAHGRFAPARLLGAMLVAGTRHTPVDVRVLDSGSGTCLLGYEDALRHEKAGNVERVTPLPSSVRRIRGIGGMDNMVVFWVRFTLDIGGCLVDFMDVPVLRGHRGLLLGNDFIGQGRCQISYRDQSSCHGEAAFEGTCVLHNAENVPISAPVAFCTSAEATPAFFTQSDMAEAFQAVADDTSGVAVDTTGTENTACTKSELEAPGVSAKVLRAINETAPIAFAPKSIRVAAWSQQIIMVRVPHSICKQNVVALLPLESQEYGDLGVLVSPVLVKPDADGMVPCRVINVSKEPVTIPMLAPVARFIVDPAIGVEYEHDVETIMQRIHIGPDDEEARVLIRSMLATRRSLFRSTLGYCHMMRQRICTPNIDSGKVQPPRCHHIPRSPQEEQILMEAVEKLLKNRVVSPCRSPFDAMPIAIAKDDGTKRTVIDWTRLNVHTEKDTYPLPNIESNLAALGKANWFTTLDLLQGFHQVELEEDAKPKTAFSVAGGQYQFERMPMGLTSSPGAFMRLVDACLRGLPPGIAIAYV